MKLYELFDKIGVKTTGHKTYTWDNNLHLHVEIPIEGKFIASGQCHSAWLGMINNHLNDELPMFITLGPIAIFAIRIPTKERYALFSANSIGMSSYPIERYTRWSKARFNSVVEKITAPDALQQHTTDDFDTWSLLSKLDGGTE